jgi:broad specificity phosphatase PhoE
MSNEITISPKFSRDMSGKFLFMRHGQTFYNQTTDLSRRINPELSDSHLTEEGEKQAKLNQNIINKLNLERVYVSPYYRALQTVSLAIENHPNLKDITVMVHPYLSEILCGSHDFIVDIKQTKKVFNMNSKVKIDWSYFDEYVKKSKYDENFIYFENMNLIDEKEKNDEYLILKKLYDSGDMKKFKEELGKFLAEKKKIFLRFESFKHANDRFEKFKEYLRNEFKDTISDKDKKVLCVTHSSLMSIATSSVPFLTDKVNETVDNLYKMQNGEINTLYI